MVLGAAEIDGFCFNCTIPKDLLTLELITLLVAAIIPHSHKGIVFTLTLIEEPKIIIHS